MPSLSRITVFPIKSLDGVDVAECPVLESGALLDDRRYALVDQFGKSVNARRVAGIHQIRSSFSNDLKQVALSAGSSESVFDLHEDASGIAAWCSRVLERECRLTENANQGFPDDSEALGPTIVSTSSLETVVEWFAGLDFTEVRRRFRLNLEIDSQPAFWEDQLVPENRNRVLRFRIGNVTFQGHGVCQRCIVPTRDSLCGEPTHEFTKTFASNRQAALPDWAPRSRFDHYYRLGINTVLDSIQGEAILRVGDMVEILQ